MNRPYIDCSLFAGNLGNLFGIRRLQGRHYILISTIKAGGL